MAETTHFDAIIVGSGQAGNPLASALAGAGQSVALIEAEHIGGCCINDGCTPTKTMVASARVAYLARRGADYGVQTGGAISVDMTKVRQRKRDIVDSFRGGNERRLAQAKVEVVWGMGSFSGPGELEVSLNEGGTRKLTADKIFINTGGRPSVPKIEGLENVPFLNSTTIMELDVVPEHLLVLGGGYIGLEFGQMFRRFGSQVTVIQRGERLLAREDPEIADEVAKILGEDGLKVLLQTSPTRIAKEADGQITLSVKGPQGEHTIVGSHLLVAGGRTPNTDKLKLYNARIKTDPHGNIVVNDRLETSAAGVWALGDVKGGPQFTHISYDDFRIIRTNLLEGGQASIKDRLVPYTVFIDPQLGRVGLTEQEARKEGRNIKVAHMPMNYVARALELDEARGLMKVIVDAETSQILGAAILGLEGGEVMAMLQIAIMGKLPYTSLKEAVFAHPTLAESLNNLFGYLE